MMYEVDNMPDHITYDDLDGFVLLAYQFLEIPADVPLEIEFDEDLEAFQCGNCDVDEDVIYVSLNPSMNLEDISRTLFHEMVHAKQILEGRLILGNAKDPTTWNEKTYNEEYEQLPWEIEAFQKENEMFAKYWDEKE
jgi:hypothetical protein